MEKNKKKLEKLKKELEKHNEKEMEFVRERFNSKTQRRQRMKEKWDMLARQIQELEKFIS